MFCFTLAAYILFVAVNVFVYYIKKKHLAEKVKKINPKVNIIFVTVCSENEHAKAVMRLKPSGYLTKEATNAQILEELRNRQALHRCC